MSETSASRIVWLTIASPIALAALALGTANTVSAIAHRQERITQTFPAAEITAIELHGEGQVRITGADVDEVRLDMRVSHGLRSTGHTEEIRDGVLVLDVSCPVFLFDYCAVDHTLVIPHDLDVWVHNDFGDIEIHDVEGDLDVDNDAGSILATGLRSDVAVISDDAGRIEVEFVEPPGGVDISNDAGAVDLVLPVVDGGYSVETANDDGSTEVHVLDDPTSPRTVRVENDAGSITVRHP